MANNVKVRRPSTKGVYKTSARFTAPLKKAKK